MSMIFWIGFHVFILGMVYLDFIRFPKKLSFKHLLPRCLLWVALSLLFAGWIGLTQGADAAFFYVTAYLLETSLSLDNLLLFMAIFSLFSLSPLDQRRVLSLGILGALLFRLCFILLGISLLHSFAWMYKVLGIFLCVSAYLVYRAENKERGTYVPFLTKLLRRIHLEKKPVCQGRFFVIEKNKMKMTVLFYALLAVEGADLVFAIDSIPAVLAITSDPLIAYTSNAFAILGLRSWYFLLKWVQDRFPSLKKAIAVILFLTGVKMIFFAHTNIPPLLSFSVMGAIFLLFLLALKKDKKSAS